VPGPLVFAACSLTYVWYAGLTGSAAAQAAHPGTAGQAAGWETRLLIIGVAAMLGLPSFGYVGLAAYLGVLIYRKVTIGYLMPRQDGSQ
jgi:hypothetical protein